jgi:hypothetical protein
MEYKPRHLESKVLEAAKHWKVILIQGARQVGKSTLLSHLFPKVKMIVFDPVQDLYGARKDPDLFLDSFPAPLILDEVQFAPELLPALKRRVDRSEAKGQYFLTGSQNFSILRTVSESLAGRIAILDLENFTPQEMLGQGNKQPWLQDYLQNPGAFPTTHHIPTLNEHLSNLTEFLWRGTFPGCSELPGSQIPLFFQSYIQTYVERDVRLMENIQQIVEFDRFLGLMASLTAQEINASQIGREIGISPQTARRWLDALSLTYQWFELLPYHGNTIKRISGKKKGLYKDSGIACYLQKISSPSALAVNPKLGHIFETWAINYIHQQFSTIQGKVEAYHWRTSAGAEIDLILEWNGFLFPVEMKCKTNLTKADLVGMRAFRETYSHMKDQIKPGLIFYAGSECYKLDPNTTAMPWTIM